MKNDRTVNFQINIGGNAYKATTTLNAAVGTLNATAEKTTSLFAKLGDFSLRLNGMFQTVGTVVRSVTSTMRSFEEANRAQAEAETKLAQVMRNTMNASRDEYDAILRLTAAQQRLGVVGDEVQLAGAQELGTYVSKQKNLAKLIPVMNDIYMIKRDGKQIAFASTDDWYLGKPALKKIAHQCVNADFTIFFPHNPDILPETYSMPGGPFYQLAICGHTHGGQVSVRGHAIKSSSVYGDRFLSGWYHEQGADILVSNGVGTSGLPVRLGARPQIHLLTMKTGEDKKPPAR